MEKSEQELYDEKIHILQEIEKDLIELAGDYSKAAPYLFKIYHAIHLQKQIDGVHLKNDNVEVL